MSTWNIQALRAQERKHIPQVLKQRLKAQVEYVEQIHSKDVADGYGSIYLSYALERKYPNAKYETKWQFLFPMRNVVKDPRNGVVLRHHIHEKIPGRNIKQAVIKAGVHKRVTSHIFRHSYAIHLLQNGIDLCSIQELLGHKSMETTMVYTHVVAEMNKEG
ncbi:MAG: tyrosine-type recombinase/integrase [Sulfurovum sp.]|nr:tyrosine-type recombinase/integrase [Sulfurovum sp.]MCB4784256.1 tyrosine-type recombinase/integrase [Sulfurovum sp.]